MVMPRSPFITCQLETSGFHMRAQILDGVSEDSAGVEFLVENSGWIQIQFKFA